MSAAQPAMSLRAYARRRGTSPPSVLRAIQSGRLKQSLVWINGVAQIADPVLADLEWNRNTDLSRAPGYVKERAEQPVAQSALPIAGPAAAPPAVSPEQAGDDSSNADTGASAPPGDDTLSLSEASAEEKRWKAKLAELNYRQRAGELVELREVILRVTAVYATCRSKLLAIPSKAKATIPSLSHADVATLDELIRQTLDDLARPETVTGSSSAAASNGAAA